jgi:hypothetical protein
VRRQGQRLEGTVAASRLTPQGSIFALVGADLTIVPRVALRGFWFLDAAVNRSPPEP